MVAAYEHRLTELLSERSESSESGVLAVLLARDSAAKVFEEERTLVEEKVFRRLEETDERLRRAARMVTDVTSSHRLQAWRSSRTPPACAWWWSLDSLVAPRLGAGWLLVAAAILSLSLSVSAEISHRFLRNGPDVLSVFSTLAQGILTMLAGASLTTSGREWIERGVQGLGVSGRPHGPWASGLALLLLIVVIGLRFSLPEFAVLYNNRGYHLQREGRVASALASYRRALSLNPDYAEAHYNLGSASEDVLDYDRAASAYRSAIEIDDELYPAYNNLARLYLLSGQNSGRAIELLTKALDHSAGAPLVRYSLLKNRGWAHYESGYFRQARMDLREALRLRSDGAAAYCLLAQVGEAEGNAEEALSAWENCIAFAPGQEDDIQLSWLSLARERLG